MLFIKLRLKMLVVKFFLEVTLNVTKLLPLQVRPMPPDTTEVRRETRATDGSRDDVLQDSSTLRIEA
jgi:hypothetical protein